jgi:hypothetical protein
MQVLAVSLISAGVFGLWLFARSLWALLLERRRADAWLESATGDFVPAAYEWRAAELGSPANRRMLARTLRSVVARATDGRTAMYRPRLTAARRRRTAIEELAETLEHEEYPVTPAGMLRVIELIRNGAGPLWGSSAERLEREIETTLQLLAPQSRSGLHAAC